MKEKMEKEERETTAEQDAAGQEEGFNTGQQEANERAVESEGSSGNNSSEEMKDNTEQVKSDDEEIENDSKTEDEFSPVELLKTIANLEEKIVKLESEKEAVNNRLQRLQADFANYRKRTDREMGKIQSQVVVELIKGMLPIIDNFERALAQEYKGDDFRKGVEMIYRQAVTFLEKQGVNVIKSLGENFDHTYHNAVMQVESDEHESGQIIEELQKGYIMGEIVIRPAMVKVAE